MEIAAILIALFVCFCVNDIFEKYFRHKENIRRMELENREPES